MADNINNVNSVKGLRSLSLISVINVFQMDLIPENFFLVQLKSEVFKSNCPIMEAKDQYILNYGRLMCSSANI